MFAHEPAVLSLVDGFAPGLVPVSRPATSAGCCWRTCRGRTGTAPVPTSARPSPATWHPAQVHFAGRVDELLAAGVPDRRFDADRFARVAELFLDEIDGLAALLDTLPRRFAAIAACGLPDTLVHGDLHPGNVRADGDRRVIVDWGDATVAHPAYDILRLTEGLDEPGSVLEPWARRWRATCPVPTPSGRCSSSGRSRSCARPRRTRSSWPGSSRPSGRTTRPTCRPRLSAAAAAAVRWVRD